MDLNEARALAMAELQRWGLTEKGWRFEFDSAVRRFGQCRQREKVITLSRKLTAANSEARVLNTIRHEIAHALTPIMAQAHGREWKFNARVVGCEPHACYDDREVIAVPKKFVGTCPACGFKVYRHRRNPGVHHTPCLRAGRPAKLVWRRQRT